MFFRFKHFISQAKYLDNETLNRFYLEQAFWIAILFNKPNDDESVTYLQNLINSWRPGSCNKFLADEYERQHIALALLNLSKLYMNRTIDLFYKPIY